MSKSIDEARQQVQQAFEQTVSLSDSDKRRTFFAYEQELWVLMLTLGRALVVLFLARQSARPQAVEYRHAAERWQLAEERTTELGTRFGKVAYSRRVGRRIDARRAACDLPQDRALGLCGGFSLGVVAAMARLCAQMAFASARGNFQETYGWSPNPRATMRMVDTVGDEARVFMESAAQPEDDGEVLVIQVDGKGAPMITETEFARRCTPHSEPEALSGRKARRARRRTWSRPRRTKGKKSKNAKIAVVGVLYTLKQTAHGMEGPIGKRIIATFENYEALFVWLRREADKRGYGVKQTLFLADGAEHLWRLQQKYFPAAEVCIDWYHVVEKLWSAGECLHAEGSEALAAWVRLHSAKLRHGSAKKVLAALRQHLAKTPRQGPGNKGKRLRLSKAIAYFEMHLHRMRYAQLRRRDLDIGTGAVEGAVRNLVGLRLDGPGMRWSRQRSERVLHLRCILINGQWNEFTQFLATRDQVKLAPQPVPALPHRVAA